MDNKEYAKLINEAQAQKIALTASTSKKLQGLYEDVNKDLMNKLSKSKGFNKAFQIDYKNFVKRRIATLNDTIYKLGVDTVNKSSNLVVGTQESFFRQAEQKTALKIPKEVIRGLYSIPEDTVSRLLNGDLYKDGIGLSQRIWKATNKNQKDINYILAKAIAEKKPYAEIMKDLDSYSNPKAKKDWKWSTVYPGSNKVVDYNSQRLMRTGINHAFFNTSIIMAQRNPFVNAVHWTLSGQHYERQVKRFGQDICDINTNQNRYKLGQGNFPTNDVPVPHPNCLCSQSSVINKSLEDIGNELGDWANGNTKNQKLDEWYANL